MAEGMLFCIAEEILKSLSSRALDEIALAWSFKERLEKLKNTVNTIKDVLLDAEERQANNQPDSHAIRGWLERLATVVYAADDLFDEVATIASQRQLADGNKLTYRLRKFFSSSNQIAFAFSISQHIKTVRGKLDDIVKDSAEFAFVYRPHEERCAVNTRKGRDQTYSYVDADEVIGRDDDKKAIFDLLLATSEIKNEALHVIPIVGIGGQGKTTLAQLIYNDPLVEEYFDLKLWVCVSEDFDIKVITEKILKSASNIEKGLEMEQLQGLLRSKLYDKRYLLVLDDVWNEDREEWLKFMVLLKVGSKESKILVTTRSREVAQIMGTVPPYELQGLLEEKSWELFQKLAFRPGQPQQKSDLMIEVGRQIVKKCANVPLAIRTVAGLLYGKDESKWLSFKNKSLANICDFHNGIMDILKLSYQQLPSPLKNCVAYCALFPKDYVFVKETLIDLWMAEGFIITINHEGQNLEEVAEDYFQILLQRCFFQDVTRDEWGDIKSCKMHDFMHDLAQQVAGVNCKVAKSEDSNSNNGIHHLSIGYHLTSLWEVPTWMLNLKLLRTFLLPEQMDNGSLFSKSICEVLISSFKCLRVLDLHNIGLNSLPSSIGKLIHLKYLNLSNSLIIKLPDSITELLNLQTLRLYKCYRLEALPENMQKLNNLRILDIGECYKPIHLPSGLGNLTNLVKLPRFIVNNIEFPLINSKPNSAKLGDLKTLNLKGDLLVEIIGDFRNPLLEAAEANLNGKEGLTKLVIGLGRYSDDNDSHINHDLAVLEGLKPHPNLRKLKIYGYRGQNFPSWAMNNLSLNLPNLVEVELLNCHRCLQVPSFRKLPFLKRLSLVQLEGVEYMEKESGLNELSMLLDPTSKEPLFFPSLQSLTLWRMKILKGWWKVGAATNDDTKEIPLLLNVEGCSSMLFPKLSKLRIERCPMLIFLPLCPNLEELTLVDVNESTSVSKIAAPTLKAGLGVKLRKLEISHVGDLMSLPRECLHQLSELNVEDDNLASTEAFSSLPSSLRTLKLTDCRSLRASAQGLEHLTAMQKLVLVHCKKLDLSPNGQFPWKSFKSLRSLELRSLPQLVGLPSGLQHLSNLRSLSLSFNIELVELPKWISCFSSLEELVLFSCSKLKSLPDGLHNLTSLNQLIINECPELIERCRAPNGRDWPKIQHIPFVCVRET